MYKASKSNCCCPGGGILALHLVQMYNSITCNMNLTVKLLNYSQRNNFSHTINHTGLPNALGHYHHTTSKSNYLH